MPNREPPRQPPDLGAWRPDADDPTRPSQRPQRPVDAAQSDMHRSGPRPLPPEARPQSLPQRTVPLAAGPNLPNQIQDHLPRHLQRMADGRPTPIGGGRPHRGPNRRPPPPKPRRGLKIAVIAASILVLLPIAAIAALVIFVPVEPMQARLIAEVKSRTGRDLSIAGPTRLSFFPSLALSLGDVTLSAPPGMAGGPTLKVASLEAEVKLWPLLSRRVELDRLVLREPVIDLRIDAQGRKSWQFSALDEQPARSTQPTRYAAVGAPMIAAQATGAVTQRAKLDPNFENLALGAITIIDGQARYIDQRQGVAHEIIAINATLSAPGIDAPITSNGSLGWRGDIIRFDTKLTTLRAVLQQSPIDATVKLASTRVDASYEGRVVAGPDLGLDGTLSARATSIRALAEWLGAKPGEMPKGPLDVSTRIRATGTAVNLTDLRGNLDGLTASGALSVETNGPRPRVKGQLTIPNLDLNQLMAMVPTDLSGQVPPGARAPAVIPKPASAPSPGTIPQPTPVERKAKAPETKPAATATNPQSIEDLINQNAPQSAPKAPATQDVLPPQPQAAPQVRGFTGRPGWSDQAIDLAAFNLAEVDLTIAFGRLAWKDLKTLAGRTTFKLTNGVATIGIEDLVLYGGRTKGQVTIDATAADAAAISIKLTGDGVSLMPLLKDAGSAGMVESRGRLAITLTGRGLSERQIVDSLTGSVQVALGPGAIHGFSLEKTLQGLSQGRMPSGQAVPGDKTPFNDAAISFQITNGIADSKDLKINSPLGTATGAGRIDLPKRQIDYLVRPKLAPGAGGIQVAIPGLKTQLNLQSVEIPVRVRGDFDRPQIVPELGNLTKGALSDVLKDPNRALETAKDAVKGVDPKAAGDAIRGALSGDGADRKKARDVLRGFIKP